MSRQSPLVRSAVVAGSLALALSAVAAPAALAQDGPDATIEGFLAAVEAKDFEALPTYFCAEFADQVADFDISGMTEGLPEGMDAQALLDAFVLDAETTTLEVVSQTDTEATVRVVGTLSMSVDVEALGPFVEALLEASGVEVTPDMVDMMMGMMTEEFSTAETTVIDEEITLTPGDTRPWVICDELGTEAGASPAPSIDAGMEPEASMGAGLDDGAVEASPEASPAA